MKKYFLLAATVCSLITNSCYNQPTNKSVIISDTPSYGYYSNGRYWSVILDQPVRMRPQLTKDCN